MPRAREVEIACEVLEKRELSWRISDGTRDVFLPLSCITDWEETSEGIVTSVFIPEWLAADKELI